MKTIRILAEKVYRLLIFLLIPLSVAGCGDIPDGEYSASVTLTGGSGKAYIESPCIITVSGDEVIADIVWSSSFYDYMIVDGVTYEPVNTEGNSKFRIPVVLGEDMAVKADTTAMSKAHLIDYTVRFDIIEDGEFSADAASEGHSGDAVTGREEAYDEGMSADLSAPEIEGLTYGSTDSNVYATGYAIHRYGGGYAVVSVNDGRNYLVIPEGGEVPRGADDSLVILQKPLDRIYLAASGAMCQFDAISAVGNIILSGIDRDDWYIEAAKEAMDEGRLIYGGRYSAPDYEMMINMNVNLAVENTMLLHTPKVQEKLESLGIPVFIDRSSYEEEPLGRCEWVKVYGLLEDKEAEAEKAFEAQKELAETVTGLEPSGKTVAIFALNSNHQVTIKKSDDYFAKMVEEAGAVYLGPDSDDKSASTQMTISVEGFYDIARDADILIYNAAIEDAPESLAEFGTMDATFSEFKAYKEGNIWCTDKSLYQYANRIGSIMDDLGRIIAEGKEETEFFHKLR